MGDRNHFKTFQKIPAQHTGKAQNQETSKKKRSHIGHCTNTSGSTNVKTQNIFHIQNNITCATNCKYHAKK